MDELPRSRGLSRSTTPTPLVLVQSSAVPSATQTTFASSGNLHAPSRPLSPAASGRSRSASSSRATTPTRERSHSLQKAPWSSPVQRRVNLPELDHDIQNYPSDEAELEALSNRLQIERKIKDGAENLLHVFRSGGEQRDELRNQVEAELKAANTVIEKLENRIMELQASINGKQPRAVSPDDMYSDEDSRTAVASALEAIRSLSNNVSQSTSLDTSLARQDQKIEILNGLVQSMQRNERVRWEIPCQVVVDHLLPNLADRESQNLRAAIYRTLRYTCKDPKDVQELVKNGLELFLLRTFSRNATFELEKTQALLLVRSWFSSKQKSSVASVGTVRAIVALSENSDERLRFLALETLAELVLFDIPLLTKSEGLRVVLQAFTEGPYELSPFLALAFLPIMDMPESRQMLRPGLDVEMIISSFTTTSGKAATNAHDEKLKTSANVMGMLLKSFTGLIYLSMNDKQAIKSFVSGMNSPFAGVREAILNALFDIFRIDYSEVTSSRRNTVRQSMAASKLRARADSLSRHNSKSNDESNDRLNIVEHYLGLLLVILVEAGLFETLLAARNRSAAYTKKSAILVGELLGLSTRVLPLKYGTQWQALPHLFSMAAHFEDGPDRLLGTDALGNISRYTQHQVRQLKIHLAVQATRNRANSLEDPLSRGQRQIENSKIRQGMQIDDIAWKNLLIETQVLVIKEYQKWNYDAILEAVEGPLINPSRLNEAIKGTKFLRRVITFFHPFEKQYSDLPNSRGNLKWTKLACAMLTTLISSADGIAFLQQDKLLRQIAEALGHLDPNHSTHTSEAIFTERRFAATLTSGYFAMLGTLSKHPEGLRLIEKAKIFTLLYHLTDLNRREDIVTAAIESLHYDLDGHSRIVLSKALHSSYKSVRLFATKHLGKLLRETFGPKEWLIRLLVTQLYDTSTAVRELAVATLQEVCQTTEALEMVIEMHPALDHLGAIGAPLLFRFLSTPVGVHYLHEIEFIEQEMEHWFHELNDVYVVQLEVTLAKALRIGPKNVDNDDETFDGTVPLHFYGELVKTAEGRMILEAKGHFTEFADFIRTHGLEDSDREVIDKLKSVLWAVGHIGATSGGMMFLENEGIVVDIAHIARHSRVLSIRGTCFYVLGLISSSSEGADLLEASDWTAAYTPIGLPTGYCLPNDIDGFMALEPWTSQRLSAPPQLDLGIPSSVLERDAVTAIANLSNNLLTHAASKTLAKLKQRHAKLFQSTALFARAVHLLNTCHYRSTVRTYILDLFSVSLTVETAKEVLTASERAWTKERTASQVEERKSVLLNPMYKLNVDTESESSSDEEIVPKEVLEPVVVVRGFGVVV